MQETDCFNEYAGYASQGSLERIDGIPTTVLYKNSQGFLHWDLCELTKWAVHHNQSNPTSTKHGEGITMSRGSRERRFEFHQVCRRKWFCTVWDEVFRRLGFEHFFIETFHLLRWPQKISLRHPKCCACHQVMKSKSNDIFRKLHQVYIALLFWPRLANMQSTPDICACCADE